MRVESRLFFCLMLVLACHRVMFAAERQRDERLRPQFHFTPEKGWMNDPNGLVYSDGEYHLFFQHNPHANHSVGDKLSWGHAVGKDLLHWEQFADTLPPMPLAGGKSSGSWSGSAVVDFTNSAGFQTGSEKPIVLVWTATSVGQCLAFSNDGGRTFTRYEHNPVIPMDPPKTGDWDRDPKVYWHVLTKKWVMAFSISGKGFVFYSSPDLRHWTYESLLPDLYECPDYFELPVDGDAKQTRWVIWEASGKYFIGSFDGHAFTKESGPFLIDHGHNFYAAQTWNNAPQGRRIGIGWMRDGRYPDMPFNQQMTIPFDLKLHKTPVGIRLTKYPVKELETLRYESKEVKDVPLGQWKAAAGELADVEAELDRQGAGAIVMKVRGAEIRYLPGSLRCLDYTAPLKPVDGPIKLRVLVDRTSIEVFANDGDASISATFLPRESDQDVEFWSEQGEARIVALRLHKLHSVWDALPRLAE